MHDPWNWIFRRRKRKRLQFDPEHIVYFIVSRQQSHLHCGSRQWRSQQWMENDRIITDTGSLAGPSTYRPACTKHGVRSEPNHHSFLSFRDRHNNYMAAREYRGECQPSLLYRVLRTWQSPPPFAR
jgi:hypothetical protein